MKLTTLFRLRKPEGTDPVNVEDFNDNFDVIDTELGKRPEKTGNASEMVTSFIMASERTNLTAGEKISISFGKIVKWFYDLKAVAFSGSYADLTNKPSIPGGAAANYGVADNDTTNNGAFLATARVAYEHGREIDQLSSDLGGCKFRLYGGKLQYWGGSGWIYAKSLDQDIVKQKLYEIVITLPANTGTMQEKIQDIWISQLDANFPNYTADNFGVEVMDASNGNVTGPQNIAVQSYDPASGKLVFKVTAWSINAGYNQKVGIYLYKIR